MQTPLTLEHLSEFCTARRVVGEIIVSPFFERFPGYAGTIWKMQVLTPKQRVLPKGVVLNLFQPTPSRERDLPERVSVESVTFHLRDTGRNRYAFKLALVEVPLPEAFQALRKHNFAHPPTIHKHFPFDPLQRRRQTRFFESAFLRHPLFYLSKVL